VTFWRSTVFSLPNLGTFFIVDELAKSNTRAEPLSYRAIKDLAPQKKTNIKIALW